MLPRECVCFVITADINFRLIHNGTRQTFLSKEVGRNNKSSILNV